MTRRKVPPINLGSPDDVEQQFYEALQHGDIDRLMALWADDDDIVCVHPGGPRVAGVAAIRAGFETMFGHSVINARPDKVRRLQTDDCAVHSVIEQVRIVTGDGPQTAWVVATNVYLRGPQGWRLVAHHASPGTAREVQDVAEAASVLH